MNERFALVKALRENDAAKGKKANHYFDANASVVSYSTGFPTLDYYLGYKVNIYDNDGNFVESYPSLGITGGSFCMFIGKPGTSKTATAVKIAANIVRPFDNGMIIHYDLEQAMNYSRIQALTKLKMNDIESGQYILRQERMTLSDIKASIMDIYRIKVQSGNTYKYKTGKKNEFGKEIEIYQPTVIILDSIATIAIGSDDDSEAKTLEKMEDISTQTDRMRLTGEIGRFFNEIMGFLREANIILIAINQIKVNPQMGIVKKPAEILGLSQDEACPGKLTHDCRVVA